MIEFPQYTLNPIRWRTFATVIDMKFGIRHYSLLLM